MVSLRRPFDISRPDFPVGTPLWRDGSFQAALNHHVELKKISRYFAANLDTRVFDKQEHIETLRSSYKDHGYGYLFYGLTRVLRPQVCVEIGVLQGFSLFNVAAALRDNGEGIIHGFDLFEDYPYRHENYVDVLGRTQSFGFGTWATVNRADAFEVHERFDMIDYLHVDISNNGDTYFRVFEQWANKVGGIILLEGGSAARDQVDWMVKYSKPPICKALNEVKARYPQWCIHVLDPYPSMTMAIREAPRQARLTTER